MKPTYRQNRLEVALRTLPYNNQIDYNSDQKTIRDIVTMFSDPDKRITSKASKERELIPKPTISIDDIILKELTPVENQRDADEFAEKVLKVIESNDHIDTTESEGSRNSKSPDLQQKVEAINSALTNSIEMRRLYKNESEEEFEQLKTNNMDHFVDHKIALIKKWKSDRSKALKVYASEVAEVKALEDKINKKMESKDANKETSSGDNEAKKKSEIKGFDFDLTGNSEMVLIGPHGTEVSRSGLNGINWKSSGTAITRKILCEIFDRDTLACASLTGKPSPAFAGCNKDKKNQLDPLKVSDITFYLTNKLSVTPREVRSAITTKCADENKLYRRKIAKLNGGDNENGNETN